MSVAGGTLGIDETVTVALGARSYEIRVVTGAPPGEMGAFARRALDRTWGGRGCRKGLIVTDENVRALAPAVGEGLRAAGIEAATAVLPAGEATKSLDYAADIYDALVGSRADRHTVVVAVGGGVVGDLAGFVAATYARGVPLLMVPTSLLAQVDSSVGGKVGVNHPRAKNIIGAFYQPAGVWIDTDYLRTLPDRELRCGLAEAVKYGVILDAEFFTWQEEHAGAILARGSEDLRRVVARSCRLKADVVQRDEREETGLRAVLNLGHTVAHAIEAVAGYGGEFEHGEAVAVGMVAECRIAERIGWIDSSVTNRVLKLLDAFGLPTSCGGLGTGALLEAMTRDKKNRAGRIRFVLPRALGRVELTDAPGEAEIRAALAESGAAP
jgi:3-dehydroquinate synthase